MDPDSTSAKPRTVSQVVLLQTAHSWANAGVLLGARIRRRIAFETIKLQYRDEVRERKVIVLSSRTESNYVIVIDYANIV